MLSLRRRMDTEFKIWLHHSRDSVKEIVSFTSDRQQPFLKTLASYTRSSTVRPQAHASTSIPRRDTHPLILQLGLVGSSTPFHSPTHAPYTLFFNDQLVSSGAVGVAIVDEAPARRIEVEYAGLEPLAEPLEVTSYVFFTEHISPQLHVLGS